MEEILMLKLDWSFFLEVLLICLQRVPVCLLAAAAAMAFGLLIGVLCAVGSAGGHRPVKALIRIYIFLIRGLPQILLLLILYLVIKNAFNAAAEAFHLGCNASVIPPLWIAVLALSLSAGAFLSGSMKTALNSVDKGQHEAGVSLGMPPGKVFQRIVLPQAIPVALPLIANQFITLFRATSLIGYIGVIDIVQAGKIAATMNSKNMEAYLAETVIYWSLTLLLERVFALITQKIHWTEERSVNA